ncbi:isoprenyl transferase [Desulfovibrio sp.]|uniref:isoprenyl transferase n=1 Tax=Desulfovibrio sp. TaxID=885 RepID=UPI0025C33E7E|nr:isoprenyl transferase [Desulfovibrio sp.]
MTPHDTLLPGQKPCTQADSTAAGAAAAKPEDEDVRESGRAGDLPAAQLPAHLAIIMDGNGRWAQARNLPREAGHKAGAEAVRAVVTECRRLGIRHLTLYTFSSENWNRPKAEISALFSLLLEFLRRELPRLEEQGIALRVLGDLDGLPLAQRTALRHAIKRTADGPHMVLNLALNYGSRAELVRAMRSFLHDGARPEDITEESLAQRLYTAGQPDPDLLIRTSGEQRLSNYLLYQCAYSELYFTQVAWPDFDAAQLRLALEAYAARSRRFGKTQEQIDAH